ncbi:uncharacterized protein LKV04_015934 [Tautogolabrus adspersus]
MRVGKGDKQKEDETTPLERPYEIEQEEKLSLKEDTKTKLLETSSTEREMKIRFGKRDKQKDDETPPLVQIKESQQEELAIKEDTKPKLWETSSNERETKICFEEGIKQKEDETTPLVKIQEIPQEEKLSLKEDTKPKLLETSSRRKKMRVGKGEKQKEDETTPLEEPYEIEQEEKLSLKEDTKPKLSETSLSDSEKKERLGKDGTQKDDESTPLVQPKEIQQEEKLSLKEDTKPKLSETSSSDSEKKERLGKDGTQKDDESTPLVQPKESQQSKRNKKNKKPRSSKVTDKAEPDTETLPTSVEEDSAVMATQPTTQSTCAKQDLVKTAVTEQRRDTHTDNLSPSEFITPAGDGSVKLETSETNVEVSETSQQSPPVLHQSEEPTSVSKEHSQQTADTSIETEVSQQSYSDNRNAKSIDFVQKAVKCEDDIQPTAQSVSSGTQPDRTARKSKKKKGRQPPEAARASVPKSKEDQQQNPESGESAEDDSTKSESHRAHKSDKPSESSEEREDDVKESQETVSNKDVTTSKAGKASLMRQECLERDQQIVALISMVRHIEVRLKEQQQQSVGRSLVALGDIIRQTETLDLELLDLESAINKEVEAADQLLQPQPKDVPQQLLLALEKDRQSLARGYEAARALSEGILQDLRDHRDSYKEAVTAERKTLGGRVESLLSRLRETEAQMNGGMAGMEKMVKAGKHDNGDQLTQQLNLCKELQSSLTARCNEVNDTAFDIQVFISERAQDLAPEQSRQLLGQLQQLQGAFHQASGRAQAWIATEGNRLCLSGKG